MRRPYIEDHLGLGGSYHKRPFFQRQPTPFSPWLPVLTLHLRLGRWHLCREGRR